MTGDDYTNVQSGKIKGLTHKKDSSVIVWILKQPQQNCHEEALGRIHVAKWILHMGVTP